MKINANACTLENFSHRFSSVSGKLPPGEFPPIKLPPGESPLENSHQEYSHPCVQIFPLPPRVFFLFFSFFFSLLLLLSLILLKRLFSFSKVFTFVKICQNEVLGKKRQLMNWVKTFQVRIFLVAIFWTESNFPRIIFFI